MSVFGSGTGKQRELIEQVGSHHNTIDVFSDDMKWTWQHSEGSVVSGDANSNTWTVVLFKENKEISAILDYDADFWAKIIYPKAGDYVKIKYQKDFFNARIMGKIDQNKYESVQLALANRNGISSAKAKP